MPGTNHQIDIDLATGGAFTQTDRQREREEFFPVMNGEEAGVVILSDNAIDLPVLETGTHVKRVATYTHNSVIVDP
ncbi:hypothetical protein [Actinotignum schaalii]|uniref:hypothetical protein n=1 Tax=Actinotignum schaalii TaxID=59505 RepID=UPI0004791DAB|nr:hypothetical protein [Actinotignum schaalii]AIE82096.1 hypothetical protein FB03_01090 [Actinotignum schaalii]WQN45790.1 hypothetical protein U4A90_03605 [Actinotignum schaalii]